MWSAAFSFNPWLQKGCGKQQQSSVLAYEQIKITDTQVVLDKEHKLQAKAVTTALYSISIPGNAGLCFCLTSLISLCWLSDEFLKLHFDAVSLDLSFVRHDRELRDHLPLYIRALCTSGYRVTPTWLEKIKSAESIPCRSPSVKDSLKVRKCFQCPHCDVTGSSLASWDTRAVLSFAACWKSLWDPALSCIAASTTTNSTSTHTTVTPLATQKEIRNSLRGQSREYWCSSAFHPNQHLV